jgi:LPS-assembly protein
MSRRLLHAALATAALIYPVQSSHAQPAASRPAAAARPDSQILLQADQIVYDGDGQTVAAVGHVEITDQGRILIADNVTYDQKTDQVTANGHVSITDALGNVAFADHVLLTDHMRDGALNGFGALIGKNGRLAAASAQRVGDRFLIANKSVYSPCQICNQPGKRTPLWQVKSERVVYDQQRRRIHFSDATVEVLGVPVLYTPALTEPDPTVRYATGILAPDVGTSSTIGNFVRVPVYIALSDSNDLTLAPQLSSRGGGLVAGEYRQRWDNSGLWLQGTIAYNPYGGLNGPARVSQEYDSLFGSGRFMLDDTWRTGFDTQLTNNDAYMRYYDISYLDRLVNDLFVEDDFGRSRFALTGYYFQGLRATDQQKTIPYALPQLEFSYIPVTNWLGGQFRFDLNSVALGRSEGPDSDRVTGELNWRLPMILPAGQLWTLVADARGDFYHVQNNDLVDFPTIPTTAKDFERGIPYLALDWRWPFVSQGSPGHSYILEPLGQLVAQPYGGNPTGLPNEDATSFELDDNNIFSFDQLSGYDLVETGPRANVGFIADALYPGGEVQGLLGQTFRLKPDPVFNALTDKRGTQSDVVGRLTVKFPHLDFTDRMDFNRGNGSVRRHEFYITGSYNRSSLQISYLQLPADTSLNLPAREQVNAQADVNLFQNWQAFAAVERDLYAGQMLDTEYGIGYEDECLAISLAYRRKYTFDTALGVPPSTSIVLRFTLKTGDQPVEPFSLFPRDVFNSTAHL